MSRTYMVGVISMEPHAMTNLDIQRHAAEFAARCAQRGERLDPETAWHLWSEQYGVHDPGARYLFEAEYEWRLATVRRKH